MFTNIAQKVAKLNTGFFVKIWIPASPGNLAIFLWLYLVIFPSQARQKARQKSSPKLAEAR